MNPILKLEHIQKYYGNEGNLTKAIQDISFCVNTGEFLGIMGASGSGKTTLLNCISTIDTVSAGHKMCIRDSLSIVRQGILQVLSFSARFPGFQNCQTVG